MALPGREVAPEQWLWEDGKDPMFHRKIYSPYLLQFHSQVYPGKRIFVPLCGKSMDLVFLADNGYEVIGLEYSKIGLENFFKENNLDYTAIQVENEPLVRYEAKEKNITIYQGDIFDLKPSVCGQFDGVWDRGSYVAINIPTRKSYANVMSAMVKQGGRILMETFEYDPTKMAGPPHFITDENLHSNFGADFEITMLVKAKEHMPEHFHFPRDFFVRMFQLTRK